MRDRAAPPRPRATSAATAGALASGGEADLETNKVATTQR